ncbi:hypothetical protein Tco_0221938 [Tanacetum coccineum]
MEVVSQELGSCLGLKQNGKTDNSSTTTSRDVVVSSGNVIWQQLKLGLTEYPMVSCIDPLACTARQMVFSSPWLTARKGKESGSPFANRLVVLRDVDASFDSDVHRVICCFPLTAAVASTISVLVMLLLVTVYDRCALTLFLLPPLSSLLQKIY